MCTKAALGVVVTLVFPSCEGHGVYLWIDCACMDQPASGLLPWEETPLQIADMVALTLFLHESYAVL